MFVVCCLLCGVWSFGRLIVWLLGYVLFCRSALFVVCCLLFVVWCVLVCCVMGSSFNACGLLLVGCWLLFVVRRSVCVARCLLFAVC